MKLAKQSLLVRKLDSTSLSRSKKKQSTDVLVSYAKKNVLYYINALQSFFIDRSILSLRFLSYYMLKKRDEIKIIQYIKVLYM